MTSNFLRGFIPEQFLYTKLIGWRISRKIIEFAMVGEILAAERLYVTVCSLGKDIREVDSEIISNQHMKDILALARNAAGPRPKTSMEALNSLNLEIPDFRAFDELAKQNWYHLSHNWSLEEESIDKILDTDILKDEGVNYMSGYPSMKASQAFAAATTIAFRTGNLERAEALLTLMAQRINANQNIANMQDIREAWDLFASGWLKEKLDVDVARLEGYCEQVIQTVEDRLHNGRRQVSDFYASYTTRQLLEKLDRNTILVAAEHPDQFDEGITEGWEGGIPPVTFLHSPTTQRQIKKKEKELGIELPLELKEALLVSDGSEPTRHQFRISFQSFGELESYEMHHRPDLEDEEDWDYQSLIPPWQEIPLFDEQLISEEKPRSNEDVNSRQTAQSSVERENSFHIRPPWPKFARGMGMHEMDRDLNGGQLFLVEPHLVAQAKESFYQYYNAVQNDADDQKKKWLDRLILDYYGSKERFDAMEWGVLETQHETDISRFWPGVKSWLCEVVWRSRYWEAEDRGPMPPPEIEDSIRSQDSDESGSVESEDYESVDNTE